MRGSGDAAPELLLAGTGTGGICGDARSVEQEEIPSPMNNNLRIQISSVQKYRKDRLFIQYARVPILKFKFGVCY